MKRSRPGKPNIAIPGTHRIWKQLADGRWVRLWYAWRGRGAPQIARFEGATKADILTIETSPVGARTIAEGYAREAKPSIDVRTVGGIVAAWKASDKFKHRSTSTKKSETKPADDVRDSRIGKLTVDALAAKGAQRVIKQWLSEVATKNGPAAADKRRDIISKALNWGIGEGYCTANPAQGIPNFAYADRSEIIWLAEDLQAFEASARAAWAERRKEGAPQPNTPPVVVLALLLACYTGLRREDLVNLAWRDVGPHAITLKPRKSARRAKTAGKKAPPPIVIPRTPELNAVLSVLQPPTEEERTKQPWVLINSRGKKWTPDGLSSTFFKVRDSANGEAGINYLSSEPDAEPIAKTLHDARGTFVTHMRCANFSKEEVADMVGWTTEDVDRVAKRYADAERIALAWLERINLRA
jgi:integrase